MPSPLDPRGLEAATPGLETAARIGELERRLAALERRGGTGQVVDVAGGAGVTFTDPDFGRFRAVEISGAGVVTGLAGTAAYVYAQVNGLSTGNYVTTTRRLYQTGAANFADTLVAPTWALMLARLDFGVDQHVNFKAVLSTFPVSGRMPYRSQSVLGRSNANDVLLADMLGAYIPPNTNPIQTLAVSIAFDPGGGAGPTWSSGKLKLQPYF